MKESYAMLKNRYRLNLVTALALAATVLIAACSGQPGGAPSTATVAPTEVPPSATPAPEGHDIDPTPGAVITGTAQIDTIDLLIMESFPVQINAHVVGWLGDGCTSMGEVTQTREGNTITVNIPTTRPAEAVCTMQLVGFEETIPLDVAGLPAGTYTVDVNGVTETFTLDVDNKLES
jgi:inhibitor of cysteine peptidase